MTEHKLDIIENGDWKNINLKTRLNRATGEITQGIPVGGHIVVEKDGFIEGREIDKGTYKLYSCGVLYDGENVSFLLGEKEHPAWANCGDIGDKIKVTMTSEEYTFSGKKGTKMVPTFELVN